MRRVWSAGRSQEERQPAKDGSRLRHNRWTWTALDADTKLIPCWYVRHRDAGAAYHFMHDLAPRLS